ncbi:MAG: hypothetical protein NTZ05_01750 [Chloroflexi bacterium]|nr:hypothetical protein [Chloroflexota bacterium]
MASIYIDKDALFLAPLLRSHGHQITTVRDLAMDTEFDEIHLLTETRRNQILVSHNWRDYFMLHRAWRAWSNEWGIAPQHGGILILEQKVDRVILANEVLELLRSGHPLVNELHRWRRSSGWEHYPSHPESLPGKSQT